MIEQRLAEVEKAFADVGGVSKAIEKITQQTNLLALNATIEASRAVAFWERTLWPVLLSFFRS
jgi:methyl-accepting chemotaxis protein